MEAHGMDMRAEHKRVREEQAIGDRVAGGASVTNNNGVGTFEGMRHGSMLVAWFGGYGGGGDKCDLRC